MIQGTFALGPFTVPLILILVILSASTSHLILFLLLKDKDSFSRVSDFFTSILFVSFLTWRLSLILTHWSTVQKTFSALLYLPGGWVNYSIGTLGGIFYILRKYRRKKITPREIRRLLLLLCLTIAAAIPIHLAGLKIFRQSEVPGERIGGSVILLEDLNGQETALTLTGRETTIVNFWATWCPPCRAELPELIKFDKNHDPEKVRFLTVNLTKTEKSVEGVLEFIENEPIGFTVLLDKQGKSAETYQFSSIPTTLVFDSDGSLIEHKTGAVDYQWLMRAGH